MPSIIDYSIVLQTMQQHGFKSLYHNSGAFALPQQSFASTLAWVAEPDASIRPEALPLVRYIRPPHEINLTMMAGLLWHGQLSGPVWLMPKSHWAFECGQEWMPSLLESIAISPDALSTRNDAAAIQFDPTETTWFAEFVSKLLANLMGSDFAMAFPNHMTICTVHHHKQLWWSTQNAEVLTALEILATQFAAS